MATNAAKKYVEFSADLSKRKKFQEEQSRGARKAITGRSMRKKAKRFNGIPNPNPSSTPRKYRRVPTGKGRMS